MKNKSQRHMKNKSQRQWENLYHNYHRSYINAKLRKSVYGYGNMEEKELSFTQFKIAYSNQKAEGNKNIISKIVDDQTWKYDYETSVRFQKTATEQNLDWKGKYTLREIRNGAVDVSAVNNELKAIHPDWNSYQRAEFITDSFFGGSD